MVFKKFKIKGGANNVGKNPTSSTGMSKALLIVVIISFIFALLGLILGIVGASKIGKVSENSNDIEINTKDLEDIRNDIDKKFDALASDLTGTKIGPRGGVGPQGPQGPPGGLYSGSGHLIQTKSKKAANIVAGKGEPSIIYVDKKSFAPNQYWFLENKQGGSVPTMIKNKFTSFCLEGNGKTDNVFSNVCNENNGNQRFEWNNFGQLRLGGTQKCLTTKAFQLKGYSNDRIENTQKVSNANAGTVDKVALEPCSNFYDESQAWYFGS